MKKTVLQAAALIAAALVIALVSNAFAGRTRKLVLPGYYPNALRVPPKAAPVAAATTQQRPAEAGPTSTAPTSTAPTSVPASIATTETSNVGPASAGPSTVAAPLTKSAGEDTRAPQSLPQPRVLDRFPPHPDKAYVEISGDYVAWLHSRGALFLDARRTSVYEQGHIAGARSFSVWESDVDDKVNKLFEERGDPEAQMQPIVIYCSGGACEDSHMLAQKLWGIQFNNVLVYKDGFPDWQQRNGAVKMGSTP